MGAVSEPITGLEFLFIWPQALPLLRMSKRSEKCSRTRLSTRSKLNGFWGDPIHVHHYGIRVIVNVLMILIALISES